MSSTTDASERHLRNPDADAPTEEPPARINPMGWLPCIRRGSDRWWLPRSHAASEAIALAMLAGNRQHAIDGLTQQRIAAALLKDPPLLILVAIHATNQKPRPQELDLAQLVSWLVAHAVEIFTDGEGMLGAPTATDEQRRRWRELRDYFRTVPRDDWLKESRLWLEVTGPKVSAAWKRTWPSLQINGMPTAPIDDVAEVDWLQQLAVVLQQQRTLEQSFEKTLANRKLEALKELAYGLSHEINNPLANISTRAQQLQRGESDRSRSATLQRIIDQVYRAHEMISDLMFYANPPEITLQQETLSPILQAVVQSFHAEAQRQSIRLELTLPAEEISLELDRPMLFEAVRALLRNAVEAIGCQGTVVVSLTGDADCCQIHIADSGPGMSERARRHAFDPYFSGREAGRGLGLGLCRAYRIVELHGGEIKLAGGPAGCVATITLPARAR